LNAQARLGAFVLVALILLGLMSSRIGGFVWFKQQHNIVETEFNDLMGLEPQSDVRMAGVKVGSIQEIKLDKGRALVRIALLPGIRLPASTQASIVSRGMVGEKYLSLHSGRGAHPFRAGRRHQHPDRPDGQRHRGHPHHQRRIETDAGQRR
jgi:phospholipid/cholesterol/gamma-HCH transport system substrate-binding protein